MVPPGPHGFIADVDATSTKAQEFREFREWFWETTEAETSWREERGWIPTFSNIFVSLIDIV